MLGRTYMTRTFTHEQAVHAVVTSYYWHFVDAVWIILFSVIYILLTDPTERTSTCDS